MIWLHARAFVSAICMKKTSAPLFLCRRPLRFQYVQCRMHCVAQMHAGRQWNHSITTVQFHILNIWIHRWSISPITHYLIVVEQKCESSPFPMQYSRCTLLYLVINFSSTCLLVSFSFDRRPGANAQRICAESYFSLNICVLLFLFFIHFVFARNLSIWITANWINCLSRRMLKIGRLWQCAAGSHINGLKHDYTCSYRAYIVTWFLTYRLHSNIK